MTVTKVIAAVDDEPKRLVPGCRTKRPVRPELAILFEVVLATLTGSVPSARTTNSLSPMTPFGLTFLGESFDAFGGVIGFHQFIQI